MFQRKRDELFKDIPHVFGIIDDILIVGFDTDYRDHDVSVEKELQRCRKANLKLNKEKCLFKQTCISFLREVILRHGMSLDLAKDKVLTDMLPTKTKRELQKFLGIVNYSSNFSQITAEVCEPLRRLISVNSTWMRYKS